MGSAPSLPSSVAEASDRASALTRSLSSSNRSRIARPTNPVPPVTRMGPLALIEALRERRGKTGEVLDGRYHRDRGRGHHRPLVETQRADRTTEPDDREED